MRQLEVIVPVRDGALLLESCLRRVIPQLGPADRVVVVDDASSDGTAGLAAAAGAHVLRAPVAGGPYAARQHAAEAGDAWAMVFLDVRCRPLAGWLDSHRRMLARPGAALSCSAVEAVAGASLAGRVVAYQRPFRLEATTAGPRLPYYPTCNLGVLSSAFRAVGGFSQVRSGGDADLCWRIQEAGLGRLEIDPSVLVQWQPRDRMRDLAEQWWRYGGSEAQLAGRWTDAGAGTLRRSLVRRSLVRGSLVRRSLVRGTQVVHDVRRGDVPARIAALAVLMEGVQRAGYHCPRAVGPRAAEP